MPLSIKNSRAEQLAREVAARSGENLTQAITHALEERLERLKGRRQPADLVREIMAISKRCGSMPDLDQRRPEDILGYNDSGLLG